MIRWSVGIKHFLEKEGRSSITVFHPRWQIMYYIPSVIYVVATLNFLIFSSGEVQKFDSKKYKKKYCFLW